MENLAGVCALAAVALISKRNEGIDVLGGVFISYRRDDSGGFAGRIYDRLTNRLGRESVFFDVDNIPPGADFVDVLSERVGKCDALIAVIGRDWISAAGKDSRRRLDDPNDFVRIEIEAALARGVRVIPVLVEGAAMPNADELPESLKKLARRQGIEISHNRFDSDVERLTRALSLLEEELRQRDAAEAERVAKVEREKREAAETERAERARQSAEAAQADRAAREERGKREADEAVKKAERARLRAEAERAEETRAAAEAEVDSASDIAEASRDDAPDAAPWAPARPRAVVNWPAILGSLAILGVATFLVVQFGSRQANTPMVGSTSPSAPPSAATAGADLVAPALKPIIQPEETANVAGQSSLANLAAPAVPPAADIDTCELFDTSSIVNYKRLVLPGLTSPTNAEKQIAACRAALKSDPGNPRIQFALGRALAATGAYDAAVPLLRQAAVAGYAPAQTSLGELYQNGQGVKQDYGQAMAWYTKASDQNDWRAQSNIATLYMNGWGVKQDLGKAMEWQQKAQTQSSKELDRLDEEARAAVSRIKKY